MLSDLGMTVAREIPSHVWGGLLNGSYSLHGGVVRDLGGRIVTHLVAGGPLDLLKAATPGLNVLTSLIGSGQLHFLARDVAQLKEMTSAVMTVAAAGATLSGLGLITNIAGTAFLSRKLDAVQSGLARIERLLKDQHIAQLRSALDGLRHAEHASEAATRKSLLVAAKTDFSKSAHFYGSQFSDAQTPDEILVLEDSFTTACIGSAICLSELGMHGAAMADFDEQYNRWQALSRKHVQRVLLGKAPYRLLGESMVDRLPAKEVTEIMDFAHDNQLGWEWIDGLRRMKASAGSISLPNRDPGEKELNLGRMLVAKNASMGAYGEHLRLLDSKRVSVGEFALAAEKMRLEAGLPMICLLAAPGATGQG